MSTAPTTSVANYQPGFHSSHPNNQPWHAVRTRSNHEKLTAAVLHERGFEPFLPVYRARRRWSDRTVTTESPLFPGYVFCRFDQTKRLPILSAPGVVSILGFGSQPAPIPESEIEAVRAIVSSGIAAEPAPFIREGQRVRVTSGPLESLEGVLVRKKSSCALIVSIDLLQRSISLEIDSAYIEAA